MRPSERIFFFFAVFSLICRLEQIRQGRMTKLVHARNELGGTPYSLNMDRGSVSDVTVLHCMLRDKL